MKQSIDPAIAEALRSLLLEGAGHGKGGTGIVLTTAPTQWRGELRNGTSVVNVAPAMGVVSSWAFDSALEASVIDQLLAAGWSPDAVVQEFRPSLSARRIFDAALLGPDRRPIAVVEIKSRTALNYAESKLQEQLRSATDAPWLVLTDGNQFAVTDARTGETKRLQAAPAPADFGLSSALSLVGQYAPRSVQDLVALVARLAPTWVAIDFTIPWGMRVNLSSDAERERWAPLLAALPEDAERRTTEALHLLALWSAALPTLHRLAVVLPKGTMELPGHEWLRQALATQLAPLAILELPSDVFRPLTSLETSILCLERGTTKVYLDAVGSRRELTDLSSRSWALALQSWLSTGEVALDANSGYVRDVTQLGAWTFGANHPELSGLRARLGRLGEVRQLGELCEVRRGRFTRRDAAPEEGAEVLLVQAAHLREGELQLVSDDETLLPSARLPEGSLLASGDILLPEVISSNFSAVVYRGGRPAVAASSVCVLRLTSDAVSSAYLTEYLNSAVGKRLLKATAVGGTVIPRLLPARLRELLVPLPPGRILFEELEKVRQTEGRLYEEAESLADRRSALFEVESAAALESDLAELLRSGRVLTASMSLAKKPEFQIANFYPFPIAYGYRLLDSRFSAHELLRDQLRVAENVLAFLGSLGLSLVLESDRSSTGLSLGKTWQGGISPGDWREIIGRCSRVFGSYPEHPLARALASLNINVTQKGFGALVDRLIVLKNDFKHDRIDEGRVEPASRELAALLPDVMRHLAFMTDYPIRQVVDIDAARGGGFEVLCLRYTGDHPGLPKEKLRMLLAPPRKGDLFIRLDENRWVSLFPFMSVVRCPRCSTREVYFVDKLDGKNGKPMAELKSFERGHPAADPEVGAEVAALLLQWSRPQS